VAENVKDSMFLLLSFPLGPTTPTYGDNPAVTLTSQSRIKDGGIANWVELTTINHNGTHIDAPYHFNDAGKRLTDFDINDFIFTRPVIIDIPKHDGELITASDLELQAGNIGGADLLLVRTGWAHRHRKSDPKRYGRQAPGFGTSAGYYLLEKQPGIRAIAMDLPSAASPVEGTPHMEGLEFHRIVLGTNRPAGEPFVFLIEDVRLDPDLEGQRIARVLVVPLWLENADAAPVTILAELVTPEPGWSTP
jgi:arylformamidase